MFDAWSLVGVGGGSAALTYLATNWTAPDGGVSLRLSLDQNQSLLADVRLIGGGLAWVTSMYTKGKTQKALQTAAAASLFSLAQTEIVRWRLAQKVGPSGEVKIAQKLPIADFGKFGYGALPGPTGQAQYGVHQPQGAWANR
jgi:hypothetical protein